VVVRELELGPLVRCANLENGITLTIENTGRVATITGNIEIIKAGTASQILRFDLEKLLSDTA
jgi:hypothetical protein